MATESSAKFKLPLKNVDTQKSVNTTPHNINKNRKNAAKNERVEPQQYSLRPRISKPQVYCLKITENV